MALMSLRSSKLRSFLTILGVVIGIASVVAINAIGEGVKQSVSGQISDLGANTITITSGKTITTSKDGKSSRVNAGPSSIGASTLTTKDFESIKRVKHVTNIAPMSLISGIVERNGTPAESATLVGTTPAFNQIRGSKLAAGRFLEDTDNDKNVAVLASNVKDTLFAGTEALGKTIRVRGIEFSVIGVLATSDTGASSLSGGGFDSFVYLPQGSATALAGGNLQILRMLAQADHPSNINAAVEGIKAIMLENHGGQEDFSVLTQEDIVGAVGNILGLLTSFIAGIASIALLVGGIGIMNIMLVSVTERTREIGIRKALGATRTVILTQFLIEAIILSLLGGALGIVGAYAEATIGGKLAKITPVFTPQIMVTAVTISVAIGIIFGIAPALQAARKRPIEALRYE